MNERIKELAEQAHEFAVSKYEKRLETEAELIDLNNLVKREEFQDD